MNNSSQKQNEKRIESKTKGEKKNKMMRTRKRKLSSLKQVLRKGRREDVKIVMKNEPISRRLKKEGDNKNLYLDNSFQVKELMGNKEKGVMNPTLNNNNILINK